MSAMTGQVIRARVEMLEGYKFRVGFVDENVPDVYMDEPTPLGTGEYPNAARFLSAAIGNCLCASLAFCIRKSRAEILSLRAEVATTLERNEEGRFRVTGVSVTIHLEATDPTRLERCRDIFEDFCIVTQSVRNGIPVDVELKLPGANAPANRE